MYSQHEYIASRYRIEQLDKKPYNEGAVNTGWELTAQKNNTSPQCKKRVPDEAT